MSRSALPGILAALLLTARAAETRGTPPVLTVDQVKSEAERWNRRRVRIAGFLECGHLGCFLGNAADDQAIRIRRAEFVREWRGRPRPVLPRIEEDDLYRAFERACEDHWFVFEAAHTYAVELDAVVLVLKSRVVYFRSEAPIEIVPLKIHKVDLVLLPPPPPDDPWWTF